MKKIVILIGSPRKGGNTDMLAAAFQKGAEAAGNEVDKIYTGGAKVGACLGCNYCYGTAHECVQKDEMQSIYTRIAVADVIVIATPVYFYGVSAQLKCVIDRLHNPIRNTFAVKKLALLSVCADTRATVFDSIKTMYNSVLDYFSLENGGVITVDGVSEKARLPITPRLKGRINWDNRFDLPTKREHKTRAGKTNTLRH